MRKHLLITAAVALVVVAAAVVYAQIRFQIHEFLNGYEEVPAVSTSGNAEFLARIAFDDSSIYYQLSYSNLEGQVTQSHIHFGQHDVAGAIIIWLCGNSPLVSPPPGTQPCPDPPATITGTLHPSDVIGQAVNGQGNAGQGIQAGEWDELLRALRAGKTYVNVHSVKFPGGEVRKQITPPSSFKGEGGHEH